jgi:hypothetical protein
MIFIQTPGELNGNRCLDKAVQFRQFITTVADGIREKYNFGFKRNDTHLKNEIVLLPANENNEPDYAFMEAYMKQKERERLEKYKQYTCKRLTELKEYRQIEPAIIKEESFEISKIFDEIYIAPSSDLGNITRGKVPFVGRTASNNGLQAEVNTKDIKIIKKHCITISMVGTNVAKFHQYDFTCSQNILVLRSKTLNKSIAFYLITILDKYLISKGYGYGHPVSLKRFKKDYIPLPVNQNHEPDYEYMENYMKALEYQKLSKYLAHKDL